MDVRVTVFERPILDKDGDWPPDDLVGFIAWFQGKLNNIPDIHRQGANVDLETNYDHVDGVCSVDLSIYYDRPETGEEMAARLKRERERREHHQEQVEVNERREYERLKAKFGG